MRVSFLCLCVLLLCLTDALVDDFSGTGPLIDYLTNNQDSLPDVQRRDDRYMAFVEENPNDITLHFNSAQGRGDFKPAKFPFVAIARNIGIGTSPINQSAPANTGNHYIFAGLQVHNYDLNERASAHVVVGHRGPQSFTIEGKNTVPTGPLTGSSTVNDDGNAAPLGRLDVRIEGIDNGGGKTLRVSYQQPGTSPDAWQLYRGTGDLPGNDPQWGEMVYVGLITYAFGEGGVPFVGIADSFELNNETIATSSPTSVTNSPTSMTGSPTPAPTPTSTATFFSVNLAVLVFFLIIAE